MQDAWSLAFVYAWLFSGVQLGFSFVLCNRQAVCCFLRIQAWNRLQCFNRFLSLSFLLLASVTGIMQAGFFLYRPQGLFLKQTLV